MNKFKIGFFFNFLCVYIDLKILNSRYHALFTCVKNYPFFFYLKNKDKTSAKLNSNFISLNIITNNKI